MCSTDFEDFDWYFVSQARLRLGLVLSQASLHLGKGSEAVKPWSLKHFGSERWWKFYTVNLGLIVASLTSENSFQPAGEWCAGARSVSLVSRFCVFAQSESERWNLIHEIRLWLSRMPAPASPSFQVFLLRNLPCWSNFSRAKQRVGSLVLEALCYHGLWVSCLVHTNSYALTFIRQVSWVLCQGVQGILELDHYALSHGRYSAITSHTSPLPCSLCWNH